MKSRFDAIPRIPPEIEALDWDDPRRVKARNAYWHAVDAKMKDELSPRYNVRKETVWRIVYRDPATCALDEWRPLIHATFASEKEATDELARILEPKRPRRKSK